MIRDPSGKAGGPFGNNVFVFGFGIFASLVSVGFVWYYFSFSRSSSSNLLETNDKSKENTKQSTTSTGTSSNEDSNKTKTTSRSRSGAKTEQQRSSTSTNKSTTTTSTASSSSSSSTEAKKKKEIHLQVEDADKRGKVLFKEKKYMDAAECFTEALDLIEQSGDDAALSKQLVTLLNNRSAMYEKANVAELALVDCDTILTEHDKHHSKARLRKMRVLESLGRYRDELVEVCAIQLRFMRENREKIRLGIPVTPPIPQEKIEEVMNKLIPSEVEDTLKRLKNKPRPLPSNYTIQQLLKSFTSYNKWMSQAAKGSRPIELSKQLQMLDDEKETDNTIAQAKKASLLLQRGLRYMHDAKYKEAMEDFDAAYKIVSMKDDDDQKTKAIIDAMDSKEYLTLLEWVGMARHLRYDLDGASKCYEICSDLQPENAEILVKRAGVQMDASKIDEALELFDAALGLDPNCADALLHRSNLRMLQGKDVEAQQDLESCLSKRPNHLLARLRLATVFMAQQKLDDAKECLSKAERMVMSQSSEVHSYRGEMAFAEGDLTTAQDEFRKAIEIEPGNPTPYVNAALAIMNSPGENGGPPDIAEVLRLLEKAIEVDPMFQSAYVQLGQLKLSMASNLTEARAVVDLYNRGIEPCRTAEELKDLCSMRLLTQAQVEGAEALGMETLN